jgi:hypothetical protein
LVCGKVGGKRDFNGILQEEALRYVFSEAGFGEGREAEGSRAWIGIKRNWTVL